MATLLARIYDRLGDSSFTLPMARHRMQTLSRAYGQDDPRTLEAQVAYGGSLAQAGRPLEAVDLLSQVVAAYERGGKAGTLPHLLARKEALDALAETRIPTPERLEKELEALRPDQQRLLPTPADQLTFLHYQIEIFYHAHAYRHAEPLLRQILEGPTPKAPEHSMVVQSLVRMGTVQRVLGRPAESYRFYNLAIQKDTAVRGPNYHYLADRYTLLASSHMADGHSKEALDAATEAVRIALVNGDHVKLPSMLRNAADVAIDGGKYDLALDWLDQSLDNLPTTSHFWLSNSTRRAFTLTCLKRWDEAGKLSKNSCPRPRRKTAPGWRRWPAWT